MIEQLVILAGGASLRFGGASTLPKPLAPLHGATMIEHVAGPFVAAGVKEVLVALGQQKEAVQKGLSASPLPFRFVDTGQGTRTGGRLSRIAAEIKGPSTFMCYCDGLADLDVQALHALHQEEQAAVTMTLCQPRSAYGVVAVDRGRVTGIEEKPILRSMWVNGGFFAIQRSVLEGIRGDDTSWEQDTLPALAADGQLRAYHHHGAWVTVDSQKEIPRAERALTQWAAP